MWRLNVRQYGDLEYMFTVSLIGPDGVGKTTIAKQLETSFPLPIKYLYMGDRSTASNYMLPTTRWWKNRIIKLKTSKGSTGDEAARIQSKQLPTDYLEQPEKRLVPLALLRGFRIVSKLLRKSLGFINRILEEWYRQLIAFTYSRRGFIVIFDRHFTFDYYYGGIQSQNGDSSIRRRMHRFLVKHAYPKPDLVICLDAPGEVVFKRKGEFSPEALEVKRTQYLSLKTVATNFAIVNADRKLKLVVQDVSDLIFQFYRNRQSNAQRQP